MCCCYFNLSKKALICSFFSKIITIRYLFLVILTLSPSEHNPGLLLIYIFFDFSYYHQIKLGGHVNVDRLRSCTKINVEIDKISLLANQKRLEEGFHDPRITDMHLLRGRGG